MFKNCASINEIKMGLLSVLEDTAFGDDMFFIQTVPTNASGSSNKVVNVYWRDRINKDQAETTFGGLIWPGGPLRWRLDRRRCEPQHRKRL